MTFVGNGNGKGNGAGKGGGTGRLEDYAPIWPVVPGTKAISVTINGRQVQAEEGQTILPACRVAGIEIPTLCYEPKLSPYGACRICVVEVEGQDNTPISCGTQLADGMVVTTHSERVIENRRLVLELIFSDHDAYCLPPCQFKCPTRVDIPGYLKANSEGNWEEATRILKSDARFKHIPILVVTGNTLGEQVERARQAGANAFLAKPCTPDKLMTALDHVLRGEPVPAHLCAT